jgi:hypothetical protein
MGTRARRVSRRVLATDAHIRRRLNPQPHAIAAYADDADPNLAVDNHLFANFATEDEHGITLPAIRFGGRLPACGPRPAFGSRARPFLDSRPVPHVLLHNRSKRTETLLSLKLLVKDPLWFS